MWVQYKFITKSSITGEPTPVFGRSNGLGGAIFGVLTIGRP